MDGLEQIDSIKRVKLYSSVQPSSDWWTIFEDSSLNQLQNDLPAKNLDLKLQLSQYLEMASRYDISEATLKPNAGITAGYSRSALSADDPFAALGMPTDPFDTWNLGLSTSWELDFWGYLKNKNEAIHHEVQVQRYLVEVAKQSLSAELARRYWLYQESEVALRLLEQQVAIKKQKVNLAKSRQVNGVGTKSQTANVMANYQQALGKLTDAKLAIEINQSKLEKLFAMRPTALSGLEVDLSTKKLPVLPVGIPSDWLRSRPDILAAEQRLLASISNLDAAKANFYPRISLTGNIGVQSIVLSDLGSWDSRFFSIGPTLYLPIFQGGKLESTLALNSAKSQSAAIRYRKVVLDAWHEVSNALRSYSIHYENVQHLEASRASYQNVVDATKREIEQGLISRVELLTAQEHEISAQLILHQAQTALRLDVVAIYRALGVGSAEQIVVAEGNSQEAMQ